MQSAASNVGRAQDGLMRELVLEAEVEVVGPYCGLRMQYSAEGATEICCRTERRTGGLYHSVGEWIAEGVAAGHVTRIAARRRTVEDRVAVVVVLGGIPGADCAKAIAIQ